MSVQCKGLKNNGRQCSRNTKRGEYCWQHLQSKKGLRVKPTTLRPNRKKFGLFAATKFKVGDKIAEYKGDVVTEKPIGDPTAVEIRKNRQWITAPRTTQGVARYAKICKPLDRAAQRCVPNAKISISTSAHKATLKATKPISGLPVSSNQPEIFIPKKPKPPSRRKIRERRERRRERREEKAGEELDEGDMARRRAYEVMLRAQANKRRAIRQNPDAADIVLGNIDNMDMNNDLLDDNDDDLDLQGIQQIQGAEFETAGNVDDDMEMLQLLNEARQDLIIPMEEPNRNVLRRLDLARQNLVIPEEKVSPEMFFNMTQMSGIEFTQPDDRPITPPPHVSDEQKIRDVINQAKAIMAEADEVAAWADDKYKEAFPEEHHRNVIAAAKQQIKDSDEIVRELDREMDAFNIEKHKMAMKKAEEAFDNANIVLNEIKNKLRELGPIMQQQQYIAALKTPAKLAQKPLMMQPQEMVGIKTAPAIQSKYARRKAPEFKADEQVTNLFYSTPKKFPRRAPTWYPDQYQVENLFYEANQIDKQWDEIDAEAERMRLAAKEKLRKEKIASKWKTFYQRIQQMEKFKQQRANDAAYWAEVREKMKNLSLRPKLKQHKKAMRKAYVSMVPKPKTFMLSTEAAKTRLQAKEKTIFQAKRKARAKAEALAKKKADKERMAQRRSASIQKHIKTRRRRP